MHPMEEGDGLPLLSAEPELRGRSFSPLGSRVLRVVTSMTFRARACFLKKLPCDLPPAECEHG